MNDDLNPTGLMEDDQLENKEQKDYKYLDQNMMDNVDDVFEIFDKQKEGFVKDADLGTILRALNFNPTDWELKAFILEFDQTGNGINKETLYRIVDKKMHDTDTIEELVEALMCFDNDHDGWITVPEMRWAMTALGE